VDEDEDEDRADPLPVRDRARYAIIAEHGRGGIGRVLRATDRELGRDVAVKELLVRTSSSEARFAREAMITARLEHPNIVPVHEAGRWDDGTPFYAMKLVSGRPLKALIEEATSYPARIALLDRVLAVTDAIAYAHDRGVLHRDLKPSNIIVGDYGETIVIDWGLAKSVADVDEAGEAMVPSPTPDLTVAGSVLGTPAYMAPEQASGVEATPRSDIYALGAILLDVLRGGRPRPADTASAYASGGTSTQASAAAELSPSTELTGAPADLQSVVRRAMAMAPTDRYPSARAFGADLRRFLAGATVAAHRYSARERTGRWLSAHRRVLTGSVLALVALLVASIVFLARESRLRSTAETAQQTAERERDRADRQTLALLEQQGRIELAAGAPSRALPLLVEAYRRAPDDEPVRWLVTEALRAVDARELGFNVTPPPTPDGKNRDFKTYSVALTPDDRELVTGQKISIGVWDPETGALRRRFPRATDGHFVGVGADGKALLTMIIRGGETTPARVLDLATGSELWSVPVGDKVEWYAWAPDGSAVAVIDMAGKVDVWTTAPVARKVSFDGAPTPTYGCLTFAPDSGLLAARGRGEIILASVATGGLRRLPLPGEDAKYLAFSPDARTLAATMDDRSVRFWDVATGALRGRLRQHAELAETTIFNEDGSMLVTTSGGIHHLWDVASTVLLARLDESPNQSAVFARGSSRMFVVRNDGQVSRWLLARDRWARALPGHHGRVRAAYTDDGRRIVTLDEGDTEHTGQVRVWSAADGRLLSSAPLAWDASCGVAVSGDGEKVAVLGRDGAHRRRAGPALGPRAEPRRHAPGRGVVQGDRPGLDRRVGRRDRRRTAGREDRQVLDGRLQPRRPTAPDQHRRLGHPDLGRRDRDARAHHRERPRPRERLLGRRPAHPHRRLGHPVSAPAGRRGDRRRAGRAARHRHQHAGRRDQPRRHPHRADHLRRRRHHRRRRQSLGAAHAGRADPGAPQRRRSAGLHAELQPGRPHPDGDRPRFRPALEHRARRPHAGRGGRGRRRQVAVAPGRRPPGPRAREVAPAIDQSRRRQYAGLRCPCMTEMTRTCISDSTNTIA
jgi:WD40 repeat protein